MISLYDTEKFIEQEKKDFWELSKCELIYEGRYSKCYKNNNRVRKYYQYDNSLKFNHEFKTMKSAYQQGIHTPKPVAFNYDKNISKWYIESQFVAFNKINNYLSSMMFNQISELIKNMQTIKYRNERNWVILLDEFNNALVAYAQFYNEECNLYTNMIKTLNAKCFIHGDFLPKNMGNTSKGIVVFDFQNSGYGPSNWDLWYFLSEFDPSFAEDTIFALLDKIWIEYICIILRIRIGRALNKNQPIKKYQLRLHKWRQLLKN